MLENPPSEIMATLSLKNPYPGFEKGLNRPFDDTDKEFFFGRQDDIANIKLRLRKNKLVVLSSYPRVGKTSLIHAGLVPSLESKGYLTQFGLGWKFLRIECSGDPIWNLAETIASAPFLYKNKVKPNLEEVLYQQLLKKNTALIHIFEDISILKKFNLLLIIDDINYLFDPKSDAKKATKFLQLIYQLHSVTDLSVYTLVSIGNNDLKEPLLVGLPDILKKFKSNLYQLHNLDPNALKMAIMAPARKEDVKVEDEVCQTLIEELALVPDQLPKLQRYLNRAWWEYKSHKNKEASINLKLFNAANGTSAKAAAVSAKETDVLTEYTSQTIANTAPIESLETNILNVNYQSIFDSFDPSLKKCCKSIVGLLLGSPKNIMTYEDLAVIGQAQRHEITDVCYKFPDLFFQKNDQLQLIKTQQELAKEWRIVNDWVAEEKANAAQYQKLCAASVAHYIDEQPIEQVMSKEEFTEVVAWKLNYQPTEAWANLYNTQFEMAMDLLEKATKELGINPANLLKKEPKVIVEKSPIRTDSPKTIGGEEQVVKKSFKIGVNKSEPTPEDKTPDEQIAALLQETKPDTPEVRKIVLKKK